MSLGACQAPLMRITPTSRSFKRCYNTHSEQLKLLSPQDLRITYPETSKYLNEQHFYQVSVQKWLARPPRPLTLAQMARFGQHMSKQKVIQSANHVAEELTIRFAHRIRLMQNTPYRLMSHPALLDTYEQYVDSFEMLRRIGRIHTMEDNDKILEVGQQLLQKHTLVVTNIIRGVREIVNAGNHKPEDIDLLDKLVRSMLTSRLSRRVIVKQHTALSKAYQEGQHSLAGSSPGASPGASPSAHTSGVVKLDCRIVDALQIVEERARQSLERVYNKSASDMPRIILEGDPNDISATFPYLWRHFQFAFGELIYNSLEACLRTGVTDPIIVTVSTTPDSLMVRISDRGGGIDAERLKGLWSFANKDPQTDITPGGLANHQFFSLLFPTEEISSLGDFEVPEEPDRAHYGLGLALSRLYLEYWKGALELYSIDGFGCDALIRISRNGTNRENLRLN